MALMRIVAATAALCLRACRAERVGDPQGGVDYDGYDYEQVIRPLMDHRYNFIPAARAETLWATRVLRNAGIPNVILKNIWPDEWELAERGGDPSPMDLLWYWIQMISNNRHPGPPFSLDPPIIFEGDLRNSKPAELVWAVHTGHQFKNGFIKGECVYGMDCYINSRLELEDEVLGSGPGCEQVSMSKRHAEVRHSPIFQLRGRKGVNESNPEASMTLARQESVHNRHAGIAPLESMPDEAKNFFPRPILHGGKNYNQRSNEGGIDDVFFGAGAPFIAGASGSIEYLIHSMEDVLGGTMPDGLVPCSRTSAPYTREALIGLMTAILVAGGQHSLGECLAVAQEMGYFKSIPSFIYQAEEESQNVNYERVIAIFEAYLSALGLVGSRGVMQNLADETSAVWENQY